MLVAVIFVIVFLIVGVIVVVAATFAVVIASSCSGSVIFIVSIIDLDIVFIFVDILVTIAEKYRQRVATTGMQCTEITDRIYALVT